MTKKTLFLAAACSLVTVAAFGAGRMQPGLWKYSMTMDLGQAMPKLPPEALAMMKARGMNIPDPSQPTLTQVCVTPEQAGMNGPPPNVVRQETGCTMQNVRQSANSFSADMVCTGSRMQGRGHTDITYRGMTHLEGQSTFTGTASGRAMNTKSSFKADFVSANCGAVKPYTPPRQGN